MTKLQIGFYSFTSCQGCQIMIINSADIFTKLNEIAEIIRLPIIQQYNSEGPFDIVFIEGAITTKKQIKKIKEIRKKTKFLIALGTCATFGGVTAKRNLQNNFEQINDYKDFQFMDNIDVNTLDKYTKIDYKIRGCPPAIEEFNRVIYTIAKHNKVPLEYDESVCSECRANKNPCLLGKGHDCLGPVTCGGCNALCTSKGIKCYGCRGPVSKPEKMDFLANLFSKRGLSDEQIARRFTLFAGTAKRYSNKIKNE